MKRKWMLWSFVLIIMMGLIGCSQRQQDISEKETQENSSFNAASENETSKKEGGEETGEIPDITVQFGEGGATYLITMENNSTARELARNVGASGRNLPIYDYDNFDGYEYFQYYDIPTSYDIPYEPVEITSAKAGEVYYSEPNRVILFYQDAKISGEYTKVGTIEDTKGLKEAVEDNPVLEGWGNKLILLRYGQ